MRFDLDTVSYVLIPSSNRYVDRWNEIAAQVDVNPLPSFEGDVDQLLGEVNVWANQMIAYRTDESLFGTADHWQAPAEVLANGAGDCEDFAILKYWTLVKNGIDERDLLLVIGNLDRREPHAVLVCIAGGTIRILDNRYPQLLSDAFLSSQFDPLFSLSGNKGAIWGRARPRA